MLISPSELSAPTPYDGGPGHPKPRWKLLRSMLRMARPIRRFAPRLHVNPMIDAADPESVAHWGEHMIFEDVATVLHRDGTISSIYHLATQLHGDQPLAAWDEVVRSFDVRRERQRIATARLFFPDSGWVKAGQKTYTVSVPGPVANTYGRTIVARYQPLRPGVIIEYEELYDSFKVDDSGPMFANNFFLRTGPPCRRRRYTTAVAKPFRLIHHTHHWPQPPAERQDGDYHVCTWEVEDAEGMEFDEWTPPIRDFGPWVDVTTAEAWTPFARQLRNELETWKEVGSDVAAVARDLARDKATPIEKANAAYAYVAGSVRYGRPPIEMEGRNSRAAEQIMKDLRGDCKDKSALLVQLLRSMNLTAHVAAVLTADSGRTPFLPSCRFNHALVRLEHEGTAYWLDAAGGPFAFGELPSIDQNIFALVLDRNCVPLRADPPPRAAGVRRIARVPRGADPRRRLRVHRVEGVHRRDGRPAADAARRSHGEAAAPPVAVVAGQRLLGRRGVGVHARRGRRSGPQLPLPVSRADRPRGPADSGPVRVSRSLVGAALDVGPAGGSGAESAADGAAVVPNAGAPLDRPARGRGAVRVCPTRWRASARGAPTRGKSSPTAGSSRASAGCGSPATRSCPSERFAEMRDFWQQCSWADGAEVVLRCE